MQPNLEKARVTLQKIWKKSSFEVTAPLIGIALSVIAAGATLVHAIPSHLNEIGFAIGYLGVAFGNNSQNTLQRTLARNLEFEIFVATEQASVLDRFKNNPGLLEIVEKQIKNYEQTDLHFLEDSSIKKALEQMKNGEEHPSDKDIKNVSEELRKANKEGVIAAMAITGLYLGVGAFLGLTTPSDQSVIMNVLPTVLALAGHGCQTAGGFVADRKLKSVCDCALG